MGLVWQVKEWRKSYERADRLPSRLAYSVEAI